MFWAAVKFTSIPRNYSQDKTRIGLLRLHPTNQTPNAQCSSWPSMRRIMEMHMSSGRWFRSESRKSQEASNMNTRNSARVLRLCASARVFATLVFVLTCSVIAFGQQITGSIVGTVKDQQSALVATATVKAINVETGFSRSAPANGYGEYRIDFLPVGKYTVEATAAGFERFVQQNLVLNVDQTLTVDVTLTVGAQSQTITVTEAPPQVNTSDAVLGRTIEPAEIIGLPLVNRNVYTELSLTPGVMANNQSSFGNPSGSPNMTVGIASTAVQVNGGLDAGNGTVAFYLDGGNNITGMS